MALPVLDIVSGVDIPAVFGSTIATNATGTPTVDTAMPITAKPSRTVSAGMLHVWLQITTSAVPSPAPVGGTLHGFLVRFGSGSGNNYTMAVLSAPITSTNVTNGTFLLSGLMGNSSACGVIVSPGTNITISLSPLSTTVTATTGFNRSPDNLQNSIAAYPMTNGDKPSLGLSLLGRGGGNRTQTAPTGFTMQAEAQVGGTISATRYSSALASINVTPGVTTPTTLWQITNGTADLRLTTFTILCSL